MAIILEKRDFLLFIEPAGKCHTPVIDKYTKRLTGAFRSAKVGLSNYSNIAREYDTEAFFDENGGGWKGSHVCICGAMSSNKDYAMLTRDVLSLHIDHQQIVLTNSLCIHYVACHRDDVPTEMLEQIMLLSADDAEPTQTELGLG
ncbi:MAG: hypothetical protein MUD00_01815 [Candidatus Pacebacteria bacterium]|jgi:hypothetical protein|nr:hypothetical protein [Candidatus Paceibacterota bacterium]